MRRAPLTASAALRLAPLLLALAICFADGAPAPSVAEASPDGGKPTKPPAALQMTADRLDLDIESGTAQLTGHVVLEGGAMTLRCPHVDVRYDRAPNVTWARGTGGVAADVGGVHAEAPEVEVDLAARSLALRGGVRLTRGDGWITAERASIDLATSKVSMSDVKGSIPLQAPVGGASPGHDGGP